MKKALLTTVILLIVTVIISGAQTTDMFCIEKIYEGETSDSYTASFDVFTPSVTSDFTVVCAMYSNKLLLETDISIFTDYDKPFVNIEASFKKQEYDEIRAFVFSDLSDITPLCLSVSTNDKEEEPEGIDPYSPVMFVTEISATDDNSSSATVTGFINGRSISFFVNADTVYYSADNKMLSGSCSDIKKGAMLQYRGEGEATAIRILAKATDIASWTAEQGAVIASPDREDDYISGYMYVGSVYEYKRRIAEFTDGSSFYIDTAVPTAVVRGVSANEISEVYSNDYIGIGITETECMTYDNINDDIVAVYFCDGEAVAAMIVDKDGDTAWN